MIRHAHHHSIRWSGKLGANNTSLLRKELQERMALGRRPVQFVSATSNVGLRMERVDGFAPDLIEALDFAHLQGRLVRTLSSGERQRIRLATALAPGSKDIALDEAVRHLDPAALCSLEKLLMRRRKEGTSLLICDIRRTLSSDLFDWDEAPEESLPVLTPRKAAEKGIDISVPTRFLPGAPPSEPQIIHVSEGSPTCLTGANGAGKSSLLGAMMLSCRNHKIRAGLARQDVELQAFSPTPRAEFQQVAQCWSPSPWLASLPERPTTPDALADWLGLTPWLDTSMRSIPLGVMALLGTAIALYLGHDLVLLDEPTQGLDAISSSFLASRLQEAATYGARIVIATHDLMIQRVASTQLCIEAGTLVCARDSSEYWKAAS